MNKPTCGPLYKDALDLYAGDDPEKIRLFAAGFVSGQAEKVYLGACSAAMFRPSKDRHDMLVEVVRNVATRYDLTFLDLGDEVWICRTALAASRVVEMHERPENSTGWHRLRAFLCGIPGDEIDEQFHLRQGFGERCD